jgi:hypothetical protein
VTGSIFACTAFGLHKSTDRGESWTNVIDHSGYYFMTGSGVAVTTIFITPSGEIYVGVPNISEVIIIDNIENFHNLSEQQVPVPSTDIPAGGISYSNDDGNTWIRKNNGLSQYMFIRSFALGTDGTLYIATSSGVYHSTDGGDNWLPSSNNYNFNFTDLAVLNDGSVLATVWGVGVFKSRDHGVTWNQAEGMYGLVDKIVYNPITDHLFVGRLDYGLYNYGLYRSTDLGKNWYEVNNGLPPKVELGSEWVRGLAVNSTTGMVFIGLTNTNSSITNLYRSIISQVVSVEEPKKIPTTYSLSQNYPNPFNPTTIIQYSIPKDEFVKLTVYDITAKVIKELVSGHKTAGSYSVEFNATDYASGTYYYKLEAGEYKNIQKMMLIK